MKKNIVIIALGLTGTLLAICLYVEQGKRATAVLELRNCELNLKYEKAIK